MIDCITGSVSSFLCSLGVFILVFGPINAQEDSTEFHVFFDQDLLVLARQNDVDLQRIIDVTMSDTTLLQAFREMRRQNIVFDAQYFKTDLKRRKNQAFWHRTAEQTVDRCKRSIINLRDDQSNIFDSQKHHQWISAEMLEKVFFSSEEDICPEFLEKEKLEPSKIYKETKRLIFSPGSRINIPTLGRKSGIFSEKLGNYYRFFLEFSDELIIFKAVVKEDSQSKDYVLIPYLETHFNKDYQILYRTYWIYHHSAPLDMDIKVKILNQHVNDELVPRTIEYDGELNVLGKPKDISKFKVEIKRKDE